MEQQVSCPKPLWSRLSPDNNVQPICQLVHQTFYSRNPQCVSPFDSIFLNKHHQAYVQERYPNQHRQHKQHPIHKAHQSFDNHQHQTTSFPPPVMMSADYTTSRNTSHHF
ncbi:hypothetical protein Hanom_Chr11g00986481 [Helianthus anomalus]